MLGSTKLNTVKQLDKESTQSLKALFSPAQQKWVLNNDKEILNLAPLLTDGLTTTQEQVVAIYSDKLTESILWQVADKFFKLDDMIIYLSLHDVLNVDVLVLTIKNISKDVLRQCLEELSQSFLFDFIIKTQRLPTLDKPGLIVMDMDSTAIEIECIDEIAERYGVGAAVSQVTEQAMRGELDFSESLKARVAKLQGAPISILEEVKQSLPIMAGLEALVSAVKQKGWHVVIASGGFTYFASYLEEKFGLFATFANQLESQNGYLTGRVIGKIVDAEFKANVLFELAHQLGLEKTQTVAIGDGANDLPMIYKAGLGVAYHAKPKVQQASEYKINHQDLRGLFVMLSLSNIW